MELIQQLYVYIYVKSTLYAGLQVMIDNRDYVQRAHYQFTIPANYHKGRYVIQYYLHFKTPPPPIQPEKYGLKLKVVL